MITYDLHLRATETLGLEVPEDQVVICTTSSKGVVVLGDQLVSGSLSVGADLAGVRLEGRGGNLLELGSYGSDLMFVRATFIG